MLSTQWRQAKPRLWCSTRLPDRWRGSVALLVACMMISISGGSAPAQSNRNRTLDEIREESIARAERGGYPLIGIDPSDVREAFQSIKTLDRDEWAAAWIALGDRYYANAQAAAPASPEANTNYLRAWRLYSFGRWPVPSSPGKQQAYGKALQAFLAAAKTLDPPLEIVRIPFEASQIVAYMRLPDTRNPGTYRPGDQWTGQPQRESHRLFWRHRAAWHRCHRRRWARHRRGTDQGLRNGGPNVLSHHRFSQGAP